MPESAAERLERVLARLEETEPVIHAYVELAPGRARFDARRLDAKPDSAGPLAGRPFGVKEVFLAEGLPAAGGSRAFDDIIAEEDATVVRRLRRAGAVLVGTHVSHELTCGLDEPPTRNPWAPDCYPGGSSAGGGASVAVGSASFALGTDAAGSVRIPAAMTGVVGLKPTAGLVSTHGVVRFATAPSIDNVGILARTVAEVAEVLAVIAGPDPADPATLWRTATANRATYRHGGATDPPGAATRQRTAGTDRADPAPLRHAAVAPTERAADPQPPARRRLGVLGEATWAALDAGTPPEPDVRAAFEAACGELRGLGAEIVPVEFPALAAAPEAVVTFFSVELAAAHREFLAEEERAAAYHPAVRQMLSDALRQPESDLAAAVATRSALRAAVGEAFAAARLDALLLPTCPRTAMPLASFDPATELGSLIPYTCPFNLTGHPAISVPCGFDGAGLPIGLQIVGAPLTDSVVLAVAAAYEQATPWHNHHPAVP